MNLNGVPSCRSNLVHTKCSTELTVLVEQMNVHLPQLLVFFVLWADIDDNWVNPLSQ